MSDLGIFELESGNNIVIFEIIAKFRKIIKILKLGTPYLGIFGLEF